MANLRKQSEKKFHIIYQTTNKANNMIYIGAHSTNKLDDDYFGSGHRITLAIEKYGIECFNKSILHIFNNPVEMYRKEAEIVNNEFLKRSDVYNIVEGGFGGYNKGTTGLKHLHHPESKKRCAVHPNAIPAMLNEGWVVGRNYSSTTNSLWIHKDNEKKMVKLKDFEKFVELGWKKGLPKSPTKDKVWIFHQESKEYSLCDLKDLPIKLIEGWIRKKWAVAEKGKTCTINNGKRSIKVKIIDLDSYLSNGWKKGLLTSRW